MNTLLEDKIELNLLTSDLIVDICSNDCGATCCRNIIHGFEVPIGVEDYKRLQRANLTDQIVWDGKYPSLNHREDGSCVYLNRENDRCEIHQYRPNACRNYPFQHLKEEIDTFCQLYYAVRQDDRNEKRIQQEEQMISTSEMLFDISSDQLTQDDLDAYINQLNR